MSASDSLVQVICECLHVTCVYYAAHVSMNSVDYTACPNKIVCMSKVAGGVNLHVCLILFITFLLPARANSLT